VLAVVASVTTVLGQAVEGQSDATGWSERIVRQLYAGRYADALTELRARLQQDQAQPPRERGRDASAPPSTGAPSAAALTLLAAVLMESGEPAEVLDANTLTPIDESTYWYVRGVLAARSAWPGGRPERLAVARAAAERLQQLGESEGVFSRSEARRTAVLAAMAGAQEEREEMALLLSHAQYLDMRLGGSGAADDTVLPLEELAGDLWLQVHRYADALDHYRSATAAAPERTRAWLGRARAAREVGDAEEAHQAAVRVLSAWDNADAGAPKEEMLELAALHDGPR
jgi:tetratricopeptide (TPR) repeat protein